MLLVKNLFILGLLFSPPIKGQSNKDGSPLFSPEEQVRLEYLKSNKFLADQYTNDIINESGQRMSIALKLYAKMDRENRAQFFKGDIWAQEDTRENYFALQHWLQKISPIKNPKEKK